MKPTVDYGLQRKTIKEMRQRVQGLRKEIKTTQEMARAAGAMSDTGHAQVSTVCETSKGGAITIRVSI